jgi:hypothetical protein
VQIALDLPFWFLCKTYDKEDYEEAIIVVSFHVEEKYWEIEHGKKLNEARSKNKDKGERFSKPKSSSQKGD